MNLRRIKSELAELAANDIPNINAKPISDDNIKWTGSIIGPVDTPYAGGIFNLDITLPSDYPYKPPIIKMKTKIYHPNINDEGTICLDILKDQWSPALTLTKVLLSISSLLAEPNPNDPLAPEVARIYLNDFKTFSKKARDFTEKYA
jgi:ubiquitin-conjugating enzyme E2 D/E